MADLNDVYVTKLSNEIEVKWSPKINPTDSSMSIRFMNEGNFIEFCDVMEVARILYLESRNV